MLIRYHLFYYALGLLLCVIGKYVHWIFYGGLFLYLIFLIYRFSYKIAFIVLIMCVIFNLIPYSYESNELTKIEGTVIKTAEKYCYVKTSECTVKLYHEENIQYNDYIEADVVSMDINENSNDYAFNEKNYLYSLGITSKAKLTNLTTLEHHPGLYHWLRNHFSSNDQISQYQQLLLTGERNESFQDEYQLLSELSLVHLFVLSGMHVQLLIQLIQGMLGIIFQKKHAQYMSFVLLGFYIFNIPMQISLYRAFFVYVLYELLKEWFHQLDILSLLIIILVFHNPYIIFNTSFIFSYFVYFIVLLVKDMKHSHILIYLATIPLILMMNSQISLLSYMLGLVMMPLIEWIYMFSLGSMFLPVFEYGLSLFVYVLNYIMMFLKDIDSFLAFSYPSLMFVGLYLSLYFLLIYQMQMKRNVKNTLLAILSLLICFRFYGEYKLYGEVTMIDVGQGDCTLIRLPMNQGNILIDTGGNKDYDIATQTIIPYLKAAGIHSLDYVYISHSDFDHCGAIDSLVESFPVKQVIDSFEKERTIGCMKVTMLEHSSSSEDTNDQSLVMKVDLPAMSILFTGDASSTIEKELYDRYKSLDIDILKVSHHGSATASSSYLFEMIQPRVAMIGVKKNNMYRHPHPTVISRLQRKGIFVLRTDINGMFHIRFDDDNYYVFP